MFFESESLGISLVAAFKSAIVVLRLNASGFELKEKLNLARIYRALL